MKSTKILSAFVLAALVAVGTGCSESKKAEIPKDLNKALPPAPIGAGGGPIKGGGATDTKGAQPTTKAD